MFSKLNDDQMKKIAQDIIESKREMKRTESLVPYAKEILRRLSLNPELTLRMCLDMAREEFLLELCKRFITEDNIKKWEKKKLFRKCIICKNKYSSQECEMCEDFDMFKRKED